MFKFNNYHEAVAFFENPASVKKSLLDLSLDFTKDNQDKSFTELKKYESAIEEVYATGLSLEAAGLYCSAISNAIHAKDELKEHVEIFNKILANNNSVAQLTFIDKMPPEVGYDHDYYTLLGNDNSSCNDSSIDL